MPKLLQAIAAPTAMLWFYAIAVGIASAAAPDGSGLPKRAEWIAGTAFQFIVAWWVVADARKRGRRLCYDYDSFVFFAWPVIGPVYLFQTRGKRAFLTLLIFAAIWVTAALVESIASLIRESAFS